MEDYLKSIPDLVAKVKDNTDYEITVVLGNESCDLDSAVCSVVLAHHLNSKSLTLPFLNIPKEDVPLKTEVLFAIGKDNTFKIPNRDDLDLLSLPNLSLILVDFHILPKHYKCLLPKVVQIIDHRQILAEFSEEVCTYKMDHYIISNLFHSKSFLHFSSRLMLISNSLEVVRLLLLNIFWRKTTKTHLDYHCYETPSSLTLSICQRLPKKQHLKMNQLCKR